MKVISNEPDREYSTEPHDHLILLIDPTKDEPLENMPVLGGKNERAAIEAAWDFINRLDRDGIEGGVWVVAVPEWTLIAEFRTVEPRSPMC